MMGVGERMCNGVLSHVHPNFLVQSIGQRIACRFKLVSCLEIHPELGFHAEEAPQPQRGVGRDASFSVNNLIDATRWHTDGLSHTVLADLHWFEKIL